MSVDSAAEQVPEKAASADNSEQVLFGTFTGVFTPTLLTIFGVIMYVRVGWAVGNAGLAGTWLVMGLGLGITTATALSLSSISTNTRVGAGGPYAMMTRSLGFEVGGSIGVPLYLTRPLGVAMYVIGFREGWQWVFPHHPSLLVDLIVFLVLTGISYLSANLAFRVQFLIMAVIVGSVISIFGSPLTLSPAAEITWWGDYPGFPEDNFLSGTDFWGVFAVFFPATTGILAGANMSGDLDNPRRAIPAGTLWALGVTSVVYLVLAWWCARAASPEDLVKNYTLVIDQSLWPPIVLAGLLGATASSALAGLVGGPRILMAMGQNDIIPFSKAMAKTSKDGNPRAAILVTAVVTLGFVMVRDLNVIAPLVTMFFLITYGMLNVIVLVEGRLGLLSFRPTLRLPLLIPLFGVAGCLLSMFIVNPTFGLVSIALVIAFYFWMQRRVRGLKSEDVRSSVFIGMAQWAAARVTDDDHENPRAWKPNLLVPVRDVEHLRGNFQLLVDLTRPDGSLCLLGLEESSDEHRDLRRRLTKMSEDYREAGVQSSSAVVGVKETTGGLLAALEALQASFFRPNLLVLKLGSRVDEEAEDLKTFVDAASTVKVGMLIIGLHPSAGLGERKRVHLWVQRAPGTWDPVAAFSSGHLNLNLLTGYRLMREWGAEVVMRTAVRDEADVPKAEKFLEDLFDLARFPSNMHRRVDVGDFHELLADEPVADLNLFGLPAPPSRERMLSLVETSRASCIFVWDSGRESALA